MRVILVEQLPLKQNGVELFLDIRVLVRHQREIVFFVPSKKFGGFPNFLRTFAVVPPFLQDPKVKINSTDELDFILLCRRHELGWLHDFKQSEPFGLDDNQRPPTQDDDELQNECTLDRENEDASKSTHALHQLTLPYQAPNA